MEGRIFYEQRSISVLVIGDMIHHHGFIEDAKKVIDKIVDEEI